MALQMPAQSRNAIDVCQPGPDGGDETVSLGVAGVAESGSGQVPEGRCDRSLARSALGQRTSKEPSRRVRCDSRRVAWHVVPGGFFQTLAFPFSPSESVNQFQAALPLCFSFQSIPF
jgi:hypothetical protein